MRPRSMRLLAALVLLPALAAAEPALPFGPLDRPAGELRIASGFDNALAPLALEGAVAFPTAGPPIVASLGLTVPLLRFDLEDHRVDARVSVPVFGGGWDAPVSAGVSAVSTTNDAFAATALGTVFAVRPGYHAPGWALAAEVELWTAWATHLRPTRFAVDIGGARAGGGWHPLTASVVRAGILAALRLGDVVLDLRAGHEQRGAMSLVIPPVYVSLGVAWRL